MIVELGVSGPNPMENAMIENGMAMFAVFEASSAGVEQLKHSATIDRSETKRDEATGLLLGMAEALIRGATPQQLVAHSLRDSRYIQSTLNPDVDLRNETIQILSAHHTIRFYRFKATGISDRTFLVSAIAKKVARDPVSYVVVVVPIPKYAKITAKDEAKAVRAENRRTFRFTEEAPGLTRVEYCSSLDMKGFIPQSITNRLVIPTQMDGLRIMQAYFQQIRPLATCVAEDGRVVGHLLLDLVDRKPKDLAHAIRTFANRTAMLRECGFAHIGDMLVAMLVADAHSDVVLVPHAAGDPAPVTAEQATAIGGMLVARARSSHSVPTVAVRQAVDSHPVLRAMKTQHAWLVPMAEILLFPPAAVEPRRPSIARRLGAVVTPQATADVPSTINFDSPVHRNNPSLTIASRPV
jgi:hypothetical protein